MGRYRQKVWSGRAQSTLRHSTETPKRTASRPMGSNSRHWLVRTLQHVARATSRLSRWRVRLSRWRVRLWARRTQWTQPAIDWTRFPRIRIPGVHMEPDPWIQLSLIAAFLPNRPLWSLVWVADQQTCEHPHSQSEQHEAVTSTTPSTFQRVGYQQWPRWSYPSCW